MEKSQRKLNHPQNLAIAIGGLDPSGHAGLLNDARVLGHFKVPFCVAATAVTAQSKKAFDTWQVVSLDLFRRQLASVQKEGRIVGVKIGMLATLRHAQVLIDWLQNIRPRWVLWDPVIRASSGTSLLKSRTFSPVLQKLLRLVNVVTPNLPEAEWLLGRSILSLEAMKAAAIDLQLSSSPAGVVILKGGHLASSQQAIDVYQDSQKMVLLKTERRSAHPRGTGCSFGAAMLSGLWRQKNTLQAARMAKRYVLDFLF